MLVAVCAAAAGLSAALLCGPGPRRRLRSRLGPVVASDPGRSGRRQRDSPGGQWPGRGAVWGVLVPLGACGGLVLVLGPSALLVGLAASLTTFGVLRLHAMAVRRRKTEQGHRQSVEVCDALAAEMRAGQPSAQALHRAAEQHPVLVPAARACVLGGDVPTALRVGSESAGNDAMATVAAAWQVAEGSGAGLVSALERVADGLRADAATRAEVTAALSPARASARLLAVLPAFGLLLGTGLGGDPLGLLLTTPVGNLLLLAGVALALAGTFWVERLAQRVET